MVCLNRLSYFEPLTGGKINYVDNPAAIRLSIQGVYSRYSMARAQSYSTVDANIFLLAIISFDPYRCMVRYLAFNVLVAYEV